ncbi:MAG TPA: DUF5615 family PIN-like protein [Chloroflexota bacterium]|nr:DUF5615 family PIN-like protein [Chloroflexota bacterium]
MRFYLDEDLSPKIAQIARRAGVDAVSSHECGRNSLGDDQQLALAAGEGRCFVSRNRDHLVALTVRYFEAGQPHAGLLVVPPSIRSSHFASIAAAIAEYDRRHPEGVPPYTIDFFRVTLR